jgi:hypothetical protein
MPVCKNSKWIGKTHAEKQKEEKEYNETSRKRSAEQARANPNPTPCVTNTDSFLLCDARHNSLPSQGSWNLPRNQFLMATTLEQDVNILVRPGASTQALH